MSIAVRLDPYSSPRLQLHRDGAVSSDWELRTERPTQLLPDSDA